MKFTTVATDAFQKFQLNAGIILTEFDPTDPPTTSAEIETMRTKIFLATSGGAAFTATPTFLDFGEDVDNVPLNTKEMKVLDSVDVTLSGTAKTVDTDVAKSLMAAADIREGGKIVPRADLKQSDFKDLWWVGDYSDVNTGDNAGFMAIHLLNALSTGGLSLQPNDKGKGDFSFTYTGHYSIDDMSVLPYEIYIQAGELPDATLASLEISSLTLSPTFSKNTTSYTTTTTSSTDTITATATDSSNASVVIKNGSTTVTSGSSASWSAGANTVTITVTNGGEEKVYTVTVTKS